MFKVSVRALTFVTVFVSTQLFSATGLANQPYPTGPDQSMTPGSVCSRPTEYRYPEHIPYCERNVDTALKREIFKDYDRKLGFSTTTMNRQDFKIDHFIPLCAGGSNEVDNLWPQHKSVYELTDPLEPLVCEKMSQGTLKQKDAIEMIRKAKLDLSQVDAVLEALQALQ
ncbi:MAG: HNH endonuclease signature motif containing protein [Bdellovibrionota bacterium]